MMKSVRTFLLLFFLLGFISTSSAQDTGYQRLMAMPNDTNKVKKLYQYGETLIYNNPEENKRIASDVLTLSKKLRYLKGIGLANIMFAHNEYREGRTQKALSIYHQGISIFKQLNDTPKLAGIYGNMANCFSTLYQSDSCIIYRMLCIKIFERLQQSKPSFWVSSSLAITYHSLAVDYGNSFKENDKALYYYKKANELSTHIKDTMGIVQSLGEIIAIEIEKGMTEDAFEKAKMMLSLVKDNNDHIRISLATLAYARALLAKNQLTEAYKYAAIALKHGKFAEDKEIEIIISRTLSEIYDKQGNYAAEVNVLDKAVKKANESGRKGYLIEFLPKLAKANYKMGNYKAAYHNLDKSLILRDSDFNAWNNRILAETDAKYQTEKKEKLLSQQQLTLAKNEAQLRISRDVSIFSIGAAIITLLATGLIVSYYKNRRRLHQQQLQNLQHEKEVQWLQALMHGEEKERGRIAKDLHDGVAGLLAAAKMKLGTMTISNSTGGGKEFTQAIALLDEAHQEVRKTSHNLMPEVLLKYGLDEALNRYCAAVSSERLEVYYVSFGKIGPYEERFELALYRIVQELLTNIIKHAKATTAQVQLSANDGMLMMEVEDNGVGFSSASSLTSIGLQSLQARVQAMNGTVTFESRQNGLTVNLEFDTNTLNRK